MSKPPPFSKVLDEGEPGASRASAEGQEGQRE